MATGYDLDSEIASCSSQPPNKRIRKEDPAIPTGASPRLQVLLNEYLEDSDVEEPEVANDTSSDTALPNDAISRDPLSVVSQEFGAHDDDAVMSEADFESEAEEDFAEASEAESQGSAEEDALSEASDDLDVSMLKVSETKNFTTREDAEMQQVIALASELRDRPFLPPDPSDPRKDFPWVSEGVALPPAHCAFRGCPCVFASEQDLRCHVVKEHLHNKSFLLFDWEKTDCSTYGRQQHPVFLKYDYYERAVQHKAEQKMPEINASVERRSLVSAVEKTRGLRSLICMACDQVHLDSGQGETSDITLSSENSDMLHRIYTDTVNPEAITYNFSLKFYKDNYTEGSKDNPWRHDAECLNESWEWRRIYRFNKKDVEDMEMLCNPEDIEPCPKCSEAEGKNLCRACAIPLCAKCKSYLRIAFSKQNLSFENHLRFRKTGERKPLPFCIPMALANDNMFGYSSSLITKYRVRWIEMAAVLPVWTHMIVYYVEGDYGHLMNEELQKPRWRQKVHGHCFSFIMPWEQICRDLLGKVAHQDIEVLPHDEECLKYMLSVHLKVAGRDFHQHLKQVHLRPFVLVLLLCELIDRGHPVFDHSMPAQQLKEAVKRQVAERYPETESEVPQEERRGHIPPAILRMMEEQYSKKEADNVIPTVPTTLRKMITIQYTKNAVPESAAKALEDALEDIQPHSCREEKTNGLPVQRCRCK